MSNGNEIIEWTCIDCPQMFKHVSREDRRFATEADADPLMCPWCGNQTLIRWEERPEQ